ncbi:MAG: tyrosine-type recombinase/integrase [Bacteroidales bacterium]|jgi:integrase/recombinase XerC|nr:tyrosine-type recombinase/integrase [Bacteroidales bacterium]MCI1785829.1 tyrosine-type recombinase/integrase [Bacteroidales bacterium]
MIIDKYISYLAGIRRYSVRTQIIYMDVLSDFFRFSTGTDKCDVPDADAADSELVNALNHTVIRNYEVALLDGRKESARTVHLHLSVLSGFCRYLVREKYLESNPVKLVSRPKQEKRLPEFYHEEELDSYFRETAHWVSEDSLSVFMSYGTKPDKSGEKMYGHILARVIVSTLYCTGIRRSELLGLKISDLDTGRRVLRIRGKGDKMREIPVVSSLFDEISLYLQATESLMGSVRSLSDPIFVTVKGRDLYPVYVDRVIKSELGHIAGITGRKSPHVLRHTLATELLNNGADLNSIKELLGHSSLAATQVYTHNSIGKLKQVYNNAHPRAKSGGKNGD